MTDSFDDLVDRYFRGELNEAELAAFEQRLAADDAERAQFRRLARLEANLRAHATELTSEIAAWSIPESQSRRSRSERNVNVENLSMSQDVHATFAARTAPKVDGVEHAPLRYANSVKWRLVAISSLAALLLIGFFFWRGFDHRSNRVLIDLGNGPIDPYMAIVIDESSNAKWVNTNTPRGIGHAIGRGKVALESGDATLLLDNGVELQLRGPMELDLLSVDHGVLKHGQMSARVPESAIGFRLDAPGLNVIDLGTEFSVSVGTDGRSAVHVFKGKVRAALPTQPSSRTELNTGESARFDVGHGTVDLGIEDPALFPPLEDDSYLPRTTGDVRFLRRAPKSLLSGTYEHDSIMVFEERSSFALPEDLEVVRSASNQQNGPEPSLAELAKLPAGTQVRSYLVHFDRVGAGSDDMEGKGSVTFDQPILGFVITFKTLRQTDAWCAHPETEYDEVSNRLLEMRFMGTRKKPQNPHTSGRFDEVKLSDDGRTLTMDLLVGWAVDQIRVLVEAEKSK